MGITEVLLDEDDEWIVFVSKTDFAAFDALPPRDSPVFDVPWVENTDHSSNLSGCCGVRALHRFTQDRPTSPAANPRGGLAG